MSARCADPYHARDAWSALGEMPSDVAMQSYIELIQEVSSKIAANCSSTGNLLCLLILTVEFDSQLFPEYSFINTLDLMSTKVMMISNEVLVVA